VGAEGGDVLGGDVAEPLDEEERRLEAGDGAVGGGEVLDVLRPLEEGVAGRDERRDLDREPAELGAERIVFRLGERAGELVDHDREVHGALPDLEPLVARRLRRGGRGGPGGGGRGGGASVRRVS
jgi:hypothetical protein